MLTVRCHAKLPCKAARTFHAACMTWHAYACAYKLEAHAECLFALSDAHDMLYIDLCEADNMQRATWRWSYGCPQHAPLVNTVHLRRK